MTMIAMIKKIMLPASAIGMMGGPCSLVEEEFVLVKKTIDDVEVEEEEEEELEVEEEVELEVEVEEEAITTK